MEEIEEFSGFKIGDIVCLRHDIDRRVRMTVTNFHAEIIWPNDEFALNAEPQKKLKWIECQWFNSQKKAERNSFLPDVLVKMDAP